MTATSLLYFLGASVALTLAPGPDNVFVVTQGLSRGRKAAMVTALGMCSGISVHTTAAALGVSAVFYSSALAFQVVKYAGAAYLIYLAYRAIREHRALVEQDPAHAISGFGLFKRGFLMNVLNPKVAMFFLAFLPQFTSEEHGNVTFQMIVLGLIFMAQGVVLFTAIGFFSGSLGDLVLKRPTVAKCFSWLSAGIFASLGLKLALAQR
ncbi:MAG: LysE family translocator [bacterium]|nr:LysE family translocator [bacterium]